MAKRSLGYVELNWECPNCQAKNKGLEKTCKQCGAPQPEEISFTLEEQAQKITDQKKIEEAASGSDIHCPFCGTRNPGISKVCTQCGGDLVEGKRRQSGQVLNAVATNDCPNCGAKNNLTATTCNACGTALRPPTEKPQASQPPAVQSKTGSTFRPWMVLPIIAFILLACSLIWLLFFKTTTMPATVQATHWIRTIAVEGLTDVERQDWRDQVPTDGKVLSCKMAYRETSDTPTANSKEVCATEVVDQGNGAAEIVETCRYEVYDDYCTYTVLDWAVINTAESQGDGANAAWPAFTLGIDQREGQRSENYEIVFDTADGEKTYTTTDFGYYQGFSVGSEWLLSVNTLGGITDITR